MNVEGKTVAVVGRAATMKRKRLGWKIDAADVVIRVDWLLPVDPETIPDLGERTDILYYCTLCHEARDAAVGVGVEAIQSDTKLRLKLAGADKGYKPYTGTVAIYDAFRHGATDVFAYNMDLHTGPTYDGVKTANTSWKAVPKTERYKGRRHDWMKDARLLLLLDKVMQGRLVLEPGLKKVLSARVDE